MTQNVKITFSRGKGKNGKLYAFVRPEQDCFNRSHRVSGWTRTELDEAIRKCTEKYFTPMNYYTIGSNTIGSNSEANALKEYWKVCEKSDIGKQFQVNQLTNHL